MPDDLDDGTPRGWSGWAWVAGWFGAVGLYSLCGGCLNLYGSSARLAVVLMVSAVPCLAVAVWAAVMDWRGRRP